MTVSVAIKDLTEKRIASQYAIKICFSGKISPKGSGARYSDHSRCPKNTTSGVLRKDPFLHDFLVIVNILLFVSELVYFDWVLLCGSTKNIFHIVFRRHFVANIFICD